MKAVIEVVRRRCTLWVFHLAGAILKGGISLHQRGRMSREGLKTILSMTRFLERLGGLLVLGRQGGGRKPFWRDDQNNGVG